MSLAARRKQRTRDIAAPNADIVFDAAYATSGFASYGGRLQPRVPPSNIVEQDTDYGLSIDPAGSGRTVAWYDNSRGLVVNDVTMPRCQAHTPDIIEDGGEYWHGFSYCLAPVDGVASGDWLTLSTPAYGAPYGGASPLGVGVNYGASGYYIKMQDFSTRRIYFQPGQWVQVVQHFRFAYDGWVELWYNLGPGPNDWQRLDLGGAYRAYLPTRKPGVNDGEPNHATVGMYGTKSARAYFGTHMIVRGGASTGMGFDDFGIWDGRLP